MDLIKHTTQWVQGEILQGRIGLVIGVLIGILFFYFVNFQQAFNKGMILPFLILQIVLLGYSGFQMTMRPKHIEKIKQSISISKENTLRAELEKMQKDNNMYNTLRPIWAGLFVVSLILFFVLSNDFFKGMSLGFVAFFIMAYTFDTLLHLRLKTYITALQAIIL